MDSCREQTRRCYTWSSCSCDHISLQAFVAILNVSTVSFVWLSDRGLHLVISNVLLMLKSSVSQYSNSFRSEALSVRSL